MELKLSVWGPMGVGKTSLIVRFCQGGFLEEYEPSTDSNFRKQMEVAGEIVRFDIQDTCWNTRALRDVYILQSHAFFCVYSVASRASFRDMEDYFSLIERVKDKRFPLILVANKCDLAGERVVSVEEGMRLAERLGCPFWETSAKDGTHVNEIFSDSVREYQQMSVVMKKDK